MLARGLGCVQHVVQARCGLAFGVGHQLHQQHPLEEIEGPGHTNPGGGQAEQRVDLGALPGGLLLLAAVAGALGHGTCLAAVLHAAVLGVVHRLPKAALGGRLVDLRGAGFATRPHHVDLGLLAALELPQHAVDQAFVDEHLQAVGGSHRGIVGGGRAWRAGPGAISRRQGCPGCEMAIAQCTGPRADGNPTPSGSKAHGARPPGACRLACAAVDTARAGSGCPRWAVAVRCGSAA